MPHVAFLLFHPAAMTCCEPTNPCPRPGLFLCVVLVLLATGCAGQRPHINSLADRCYVAATLATETRLSVESPNDLCDRALTVPLSRRDQAATYTNRGILRLNQSAYDLARQDFDQAVSLAPDLGETYINRGAALLGLHRNSEALQDLDRGIALSPSHPERAFYNRAMARERLNDIKGAYYDYLKASELRPEWELPKRDLQRFKVITRRNAVA